MAKKTTPTGVKRPANADYVMNARTHSGQAFTVDGYPAPLQGEPPIATSHGWGNLGWLYAPRLGGN
jgi:hypothetical protein